MTGRGRSPEAAEAPTGDGQRIDRWLWFARVVKSRTLAAGLVAQGRVRVNREKVVKPSHTLRPGDVLTIAVGPRIRILKVLVPGMRRGPASEAQMLYEDLSPPEPPRDSAARPVALGERAPGAGRPTKRDRRLTDRLKGDPE